MRKTQLLSNKPVCLCWSELNNSKKILQKVYKEDVETRLDTINFELDRWLPKGKSKKVIGLMRDELGQQIMKKKLLDQQQKDIAI